MNKFTLQRLTALLEKHAAIDYPQFDKTVCICGAGVDKNNDLLPQFKHSAHVANVIRQSGYVGSGEAPRKPVSTTVEERWGNEVPTLRFDDPRAGSWKCFECREPLQPSGEGWYRLHIKCGEELNTRKFEDENGQEKYWYRVRGPERGNAGPAL